MLPSPTAEPTAARIPPNLVTNNARSLLNYQLQLKMNNKGLEQAQTAQEDKQDADGHYRTQQDNQRT